MPFTPTHVAAVVPIAMIGRGALPFSALAIGSMIPDFPLFVPVGPSYPTTHSLLGVFTACLPLGFGVFLIFQVLWKRPLLDLLPRVIRRRCVSFTNRPFERTLQEMIKASLAVVIGASTHVLWDSFTHQGRWGTRLFPKLNETVLTISGHPVAGFKLLQYGSTLIGLPGLVVLLVIWLRRQKVESGDTRPGLSATARRSAWLVAATIPLVVTFVVGIRGEGTAYRRLGLAITWSGLGLMIALIAYGLVYQRIVDGTSRVGR